MSDMPIGSWSRENQDSLLDWWADNGTLCRLMNIAAANVGKKRKSFGRCIRTRRSSAIVDYR